ncbi:isopeptide-forming domain-containing fimbrial protein [Xylanimonas allomyrinae]|uniref:Isopeptide-forming domain-containing fimbrial protein n=1 Tax=Xylanimonas allomyrinae TaxID=2509459 RepID=A0A4P6EWQ4_9MICO|nr:isopeptide-forming domain-containing fimbrial protein [Xylanimonas allomyrinae]QAY62438.1 isopeptide-forming domain-containing fimbrial protein [Xylanimonas allomyrinae]
MNYSRNNARHVTVHTRSRRRRGALCRKIMAGIGGLAVVLTPLVVPAAGADDLAAAFASGVVIVDANNDGAVGAASPMAGASDAPLAGVAVVLRGTDPQHPGWTTTTAADGTWAFPEGDYTASPGPYTVTIDVDGVGGDVYATSPPGKSNAFTPVPDEAQQAKSATFEAGGSIVLNALVYPAWGFDLALANDPVGYQGKSLYTGTTPFDAAEGVGNDVSQADAVVRTGDVVSLNWSLTAAHNVAVSDTLPDATLEQTITLGDGAVANFAEVPPICASATIVARPSGTAIAPRTDPPAGTKSVVLTCGLGDMGEDRAAILLPTSIWVSGNSTSGAQFSTSARAYATGADGVAVARPSDAGEYGPFTITAAPHYDIAKWGAITATGPTNVTFNGVASTSVYTLTYVVTISTDRAGGAEAFSQPITVQDAFWATYGDGQTGESGTVVPDLKYEISTCAPVTPSNLNNTAVPVWGALTGTATTANTVAGSGTCATSRPSGSDEPYTLTLSGIDTSASRYPTQTVKGADLSAGPFYVASYLVTVRVPVSEIDRATGAADDGSGSLTFYNRVGGFDPVGASGTSNYGAGEEPGYCEVGPADDGVDNCDLMPDSAAERSNNVAGPKTVTVTPSTPSPTAPTWAKYFLDNTTPWSYSFALLPEAQANHDGAALVQPGEVHTTDMTVTAGSSTPLTNVQQCDVFDNSMATLAPLNATTGKTAMRSLADDRYSYVLRSGGSVAVNQAFNDNFVVEYAHVDLTGNDPDTGSFDALNNRWKGDWTAQKAVSCAQVPEDQWKSDPNAVPGGIDEVNVARMSAKDGFVIEPGLKFAWWLAFEQRETFHGGPHDGQAIPGGTVFANFGRVRSDEWQPDWNASSYIPGAGTTDGIARNAESTSSQGDRWTVTLATMRLTKRTIAADVGGVQATGVADVGVTGSAIAGRPVVWEITPTLSATSDAPAPISDVVVTDTLPAFVTYDDAATAAVAGGTPASTYHVNADGTTTLTWTLGRRTPNEAITPLRVVTGTDPLAPNGTTLVNTATITASGVVPRATHTDTHTVRLAQTGEVQLKKTVDHTLDLQDGQQAYTLRLKNFSATLPIAAPTLIDVLAYNGDASGNARVNRSPESAYSGTNTLAAPPQAFEFDGTTPLSGTFFYTTVPAAQVPQSLNDDTDPAIWTTEFTTDATAVKFVAGQNLATTADPSASGLTITYTTQQAGNRAGDLYANRFTAFSDTLMNGSRYQMLASNQTTVRVLGFSLGDLVWIETDDDGVYTPGVDLPAPAGVVVEVYDGDDTLVATSTTDENGRWVVDDLPQGSYYVRIPASQFAAGGPLAGLRAYPDPEEDPNGDLNEQQGHNGVADSGPGATPYSVVTAPITLSAAVDGDTITGKEPLGDNTASMRFSALTTDDFTNLTLDIALFAASDYTFAKTADPASGTAVAPGDTVTYTLTGTNTGGTPLEVTITDDLSAVLAHAGLVDGSVVATVDGAGAQPAPVVNGTTLSWTGRLDPGQVVHVTYAVVVNAGSEGATLRNLARSTAVPPSGTEIVPPEQETTHPVPGYELTKTADPADGTSVRPGEKVTYTLTGTNTGATRLDPVTITDDLAHVLDHASLDGDPVATVTGSDGAARTAGTTAVSATGLVWTGVLEVGETVTVTYTVTVDADCPDTSLVNVAVSSATPPGTDPITPPEADTTHPVDTPEPTPAVGVPSAPPAPSNEVVEHAHASWLPRTGAEIGVASAAVVVLLGAGVLLIAATRARRRL